MSTLQKGTLSLTYSYDEQGIRIAKTANGVTTAYYTAGSVLLGESRSDGTEILYYYDENGAPFALRYNGTYYHYLRNIQGDIVVLLNAQGTVVAQYIYDAWGKLLSVTNASGTSITDPTHVGNINPLRYRGYYYDTDTGLYYLQTRYYDPEVGRFLNADSIVSGVGGDARGYNPFAYCFNNPVMYIDESGEFAGWIIGLCLLAIVSYSVAKNSIEVAESSKILEEHADVQPMEKEQALQMFEDPESITADLSLQEQIAYIRALRLHVSKIAENWTEAEMLREMKYHNAIYNIVLFWGSDPDKKGSLANRSKHVDFEGKQTSRTYLFRYIGNCFS